MKTNIITLIALIITITGCGGGGSGEASTSPTKTVQITAPTVDLPKVATTTSELTSEPAFNLTSNTHLDVTLPASPSTNITYFINICTAFSTQNNQVNIKYDSCKLRTSLTTEEQPFILSISAAELMLVAQIWPVEDGAQPITLYWNINESGNSWTITI